MAPNMRIMMRKQGLGAEPSGKPAILGTPQEDATLTADYTTIKNNFGFNSITYQWYKDSIPFSTNISITLGQADVGSVFYVDVSFVDNRSKNYTFSSDPTVPVANVNDPATGQPVILGGTINTTASVDTSGISDLDGGVGPFTYQWYLDGAEIIGETGATYDIQASDEGSDLTVAVTYTDTYGSVETVTSAPVTVINDIRGSVNFQTPDTYDWTVPQGVTSISIVAVGAGGCANSNEGGGGGALAYRNNVSVTPGQVLTLTVPAGPPSGTTGRVLSAKVNGIIEAQSGECGISSSRGGFGGQPLGTYDGGGTGGRGGAFYSGRYEGGGGAGGYSGNGGNGGGRTLWNSTGTGGSVQSASAGSGGGGAGGGNLVTADASTASGGGVGLYGQGSSGTIYGGGGSGGTPGTGGTGICGGGGGAGSYTYGGRGGIRIVWGNGRAFPSTDVNTTDGEIIL